MRTPTPLPYPSYSTRVAECRPLLTTHGVDQLMISGAADIRWLTGFTGSNAIVLVSLECIYLFTDGRYRIQAQQGVSGAQIIIAENDLYPAMQDYFSSRVAIQSDVMTLANRKRVDRFAPATTLVETEGLLTILRASKDSVEVELTWKALSISEQAIAYCVAELESGITERELAAEIDHQHARLGSEGPSFETIVAFGPRSALPHARPGNTPLKPGDVVLIDCGCTVGGYASDITRTSVFQKSTTLIAEVYDVVKRALDASLLEAKSGMLASDLDHVARSVIEDAGYAEFFVHSLGHGVGLEIHEWPRISRHSNQPLPERAIITIEPGIYLPDQFGIRIEEMVLLSNECCVRMNNSNTDLTIS